MKYKGSVFEDYDDFVRAHFHIMTFFGIVIPGAVFLIVVLFFPELLSYLSDTLELGTWKRSRIFIFFIAPGFALTFFGVFVYVAITRLKR